MSGVLRCIAGGVVALLTVPVVVVIAVSDDAAELANALTYCGARTFPPGAMPAATEDLVLAAIRHVESGGDYTAEAAGSSASGAYQFIDSTWANYQGYRHAAEAPPEVQDAKARELVRHIIEETEDWTLVPAWWYVGHIPRADEWDQVPAPEAGNSLTIRQYSDRWMAAYQAIANGELPTDPTSPSQCLVPGAPIPAPGGAALPLQGLTADVWAVAHHTYPAIDVMVPTGTPVYAWHGGTVRSVKTYAHNCYEAGEGDACVGTCGIGMTVVDVTWPDVTWTYCHFQAIAVRTGDVIVPGQHVANSGNTGRSGAPHLHLEIRISGQRVCPQPLLEELASTGRIIDPHNLPSSGCSF